MSVLPTATRRRRLFDARCREQEDEEEEGEIREVVTSLKRKQHEQELNEFAEEAQEEEEEEVLRENGHKVRNCAADEVRNSVNAKIGHFERLLSAGQQQAMAASIKDCRPPFNRLDDLLDHDEQINCRRNEDENDQLEELDEEAEYLGLDTILEEEELNFEASNSSDGPLMFNAIDCDTTTSATTSQGVTSQRNFAGGAMEVATNHGQPRGAPPAEMTTDDCSVALNHENEEAAAEEAFVVQEDKQQLEASETRTISENIIGNATTQNNNSMEHKGRLATSFDDDEQQLTEAQQNNDNSSKQQMVGNLDIMANNKQQQKQAPALLLPSTNRLISEHQARQQQALFRALAERQKLLDELGPDERQLQVDLMSSSPASWAACGQARADRHSSRRHHRKSRRSSQQANGQLNHQLATSSSSSKSAGVPLSSVDLSTVSDRMLDELLGHIASASSSSSSSSSSAHSLISSQLSSSSSCSSLSNESSSSSSPQSGASASASSSSDELDQDGARLSRRPGRTRRHKNHRRHKSSQATTGAQLNGQVIAQQSQDLDLEATGAPSVIGVHDELHAEQQVDSSGTRRSGRKCREAHKKARNHRRRRDSDDDEGGGGGDDDPDRRNPGELRVDCASALNQAGQQHSNSLGSQWNGSSNGIGGGASSLSPATVGLPLQRREQDSSDRFLAPLPPKVATNARNSPNTSDEPSSISLHEELNGGCEAREILSESGNANANESHSVEAILGRMLEALQEVGTQRQVDLEQQQQILPMQQPGEDQEQLSDLLERGFLHLEQLLNCSLATPQISRLDGSEPLPSRSQGNLEGAAQPVQKQPPVAPPSALAASNPSILLSKDSDYGSDTQSADCLSHSTHSTNGEPGRLVGGAMTNSQAQQIVQAHSIQQQQQQAGGALSPLAIELSFKLAESLRKLAQQRPSQLHKNQATLETAMTTDQCESQQQRQMSNTSASPQPPVVQPRRQAPVATTAEPATANQQQQRAQWKSVVMINSPLSSGPSASSTLSRPHSSQSTASSASSASCTSNGGGVSLSRSGAAGNLQRRNVTPPTPTSDHDESTHVKQRPLFKTCISLNASSSSSPPAARQDIKLNDDKSVSASLHLAKKEAGNQQVNQELQQEANKQEREQEQDTSRRLPPVAFERRPHAGSFRQASLRRRPSFKLQASGPTPRPGSPVPRSPLAERCATSELTQSPMAQAMHANSSATSAGGDAREQSREEEGGKNMRQLQRALILAQKYDYSPAKLAASKLGAKLQLPVVASTTTTNVVVKDELAEAQAAGQVGKLRQDDEHAAKAFSAGQVELEIAYFAKSGSLTVHLLQCAHLAPISKRRTTSNPYVKLYLLPDRSKQGKRKSAVKRHELAPKFDERFTFGPLQLADFDERYLWLSVWHKDRGLGRSNEPLGELLLPLAQVRTQLLSSDLCQTTSARWYPLRQRHLSPQPATKQELKNGDDDDERQAVKEISSAPHKQSSKSLLTTKRVPQSNGHLSLTLARPNRSGSPLAPRLQQQRAAELVAKKLSEFEMKAARLTQQTASLTPSSGGGQSLSNISRSMPLNNLGNNHTLRSSEFKCMQVALARDQLIYQSSDPSTFNGGQLFVALKFVPNSNDLRRSAHMEGRLELLIKEARNLRASQPAPSAYCKCYLLDAFGQRQAKRKTPVIKRTDSPRWDFECRFNALQLSHLNAQAIELILLNRDNSSNLSASNSNGADGQHLGAIRLCRRLNENTQQQQTTTGELPDLCSEREARLWTQMLARPNIWVYGELPLKRQLCPLIALNSNNNSATSQQATGNGHEDARQ